MLYFLLPYGNICSLIRLFYKISYIFMIRKIVRKCAVTRIRPQDTMERNARFTIYYMFFLITDIRRYHYLKIDKYKKNSVANIRELIGMINEDSLKEAKQHLLRVLPLEEAAPLPEHYFRHTGMHARCDNCGARHQTCFRQIQLWIYESRWSSCAGCVDGRRLGLLGGGGSCPPQGCQP